MARESLEGKIVMVTGASSGLGAEIARQLTAENCIVYAGARRYNRLAALANEPRGKGTIVPVELDVRSYKAVSAAAQRMVDERKRIDIWVNNAGSETLAGILELTPELVREITEVNYYGVVWGMMAAAKQMTAQGSGDIVNVLSTSAFTPRQREDAYCGAKNAAEMFGKCAGLELRPKIRVIPVYPGGMGTEFASVAGAIVPKDAMDSADVARHIVEALASPRNVCADIRLYRNA
ncbi:SDR family NAD(P)-dependent oxidoreductase [Candidatus Woesearchaeota archaeon]|nr:SDR family NAD(P)-dependent oxidoreductase [Candidatus Woesearchaeota archaeon]